MNHDRTLAVSPFPDDDGVADTSVRDLLAAAVTGPQPQSYLRAVAALCGDRVLVPVVATATSLGTTTGGLLSDKEAEMAVVMLRAADGRQAMLAFTGMDSLQAWDAQARPVPVTLDLAAKSALSEGATTVLVDFAGPAPLAIDGEVLDQLAAGHRLIELEADQFGWAMPAAPDVP